MPTSRPRTLRLLSAALAAVSLVLLALAACDGLPVAPPDSATPNVVYVTATPEGFVPSPGPNVIYVTATPDGVGGQAVAGDDGEPTPYVIYVTATPPRVGPFNLTAQPGPATGAPEPTLDLSGVTLVPTPDRAATATPTPTPTGPQPSATPQPTPTATARPTLTPLAPQAVDGALYADRFGLNFISSGQHEGDGDRFRTGVEAGAGWDRFAIYWNDIEWAVGEYEWGEYDEVIRNDVVYGLRTNAILLGAPEEQQTDSGTPRGLNRSVFDDGTDTPGADKKINAENGWARFVFTTVNRYRPGGLLARRESWPEGAGVRVWEVWNEPDFTLFWKGTPQEYARLVKVTYLAARHADPDAQIMLGGLVLFEQPRFILDVMSTFHNDPEPADQRYPFDMVAVHAYSNPGYSFDVLQRVETLLAVHGLKDMPVWLNESGVAVWNDYPGPTWATEAEQRYLRATLDEQAAYIVENAAFALLGGADKIFHFQLYDDCGNQPYGTTFAPHDGSLCADGAACWGDALGLLRNRTDNACFNQHPQAGSERPAYTAYRLAAELFGTQRIVPLTGYTFGGRQWIILARPDSREIVTVIWDETGQGGEVVVRPRSTQATVRRIGAEPQTITPAEDGSYHLWLDPATNRNQIGGSPFGFMIGGPPVVLIEQSDTPVVTVLPLRDVTQTAALVKWRASSPDIVRYEVYYRDDSSGSGEWVRWLETDQPGEEIFATEPGRAYSFFARGMTADGQWTQDVPFAQAWTTLE